MSDKTVIEKLGLKKGERILVLNAPAGVVLGDLPGEAVLVREKAAGDVVLLFVTGKKELVEQLPSLKGLLNPKGRLWVAYPKAGQVNTDLNRDIIREYARTIGLEGVSIFSIDETWSALRLKVL